MQDEVSPNSKGE